MLMSARQRIYFSASPERLQEFQAEIGALIHKGTKVVVLSQGQPVFSALTDEEKSNIIYYEHIPQEEQESVLWNREEQLQLIVDSQYVLTGTYTGQQEDTCLYCAQQNFVSAIKDGMRNEIKLIELMKKE